MKKYRAREGGLVIHMSDEAAETLVPGIYERVSDDTPMTSELNPPIPAPVPPQEPAKKPAPKKGSSTAVKPLGTDDMPSQPKKGKPIK